MSLFKDKTLLITGGTGSFGNVVLNRFLNRYRRDKNFFPRREKAGRHASRFSDENARGR